MKRVTLMLVVRAAIVVGVLVGFSALSLSAQLWALAGLTLALVGVGVMGRETFVGRYHMRRRDWRAAIDHLVKFERSLLSRPLPRARTLLCMSIYTLDGVAVVRNNLGFCFLNLRELDEAERWLNRALERDGRYALPHVTLGVLASMRGDKDQALRQFNRAVELGYSEAGMQRLMRRLAANVNVAMGAALKKTLD